MIYVCSLLMYNALVDLLFLGDVRLGLLTYLLTKWMLLAPSLNIILRYLLINWSIKTNNNTLASTYPHYPFIIHQSFSSSLSKSCFISYLNFCKVNFVPVLKKGVKFRIWAMVYLPGGNNKFSRLFESGKILFFYILFNISKWYKNIYVFYRE